MSSVSSTALTVVPLAADVSESSADRTVRIYHNADEAGARLAVGSLDRLPMSEPTVMAAA